jgi:hypothetical protein
MQCFPPWQITVSDGITEWLPTLITGAFFYVLSHEKSTGLGAFEMLINKYTGGTYPEMGPNMMWKRSTARMLGGRQEP